MYPPQGLLGLGPMNSNASKLRIMSIVIMLLIFFIVFEQLHFIQSRADNDEYTTALRNEHASLVERYNEVVEKFDTINAKKTISLSKIEPESSAQQDSTKDTTFRSRWIDSVSSTGAQKITPSTKTDTNVKTPVRVLVPIADGSEELETVTITDILHRFGAEVTVASVKKDRKTGSKTATSKENLTCEMSQGLKIQADVTIEQASQLVDDTDHGPWHLIVLPGGMPGATSLRDSKILKQMLMQHHNKGRLIGAICASPSVILRSYGIIDGSRLELDTATKGQKPKDAISATGYPSKMFPLNLRSEKKVVLSHNIVTSQGPGTSILFAMKLGEELFGNTVAKRVADDLLLR
jgi:4-methyl-5(b-hydroxyethyl)-thiazole monophosphate biosynthesis